MNTPIPPNARDRIEDALFRGQKIEAIKLYRESQNTGLAEAKAAVERLEMELRQARPEKFREAAESSGGADRSFCLDSTAQSFRPSDFGLRDVPIFIVVFLLLSAVSVGVGFATELVSREVRFTVLGFIAGCVVGIAIGKWSSRRASTSKETVTIH